MKLNLNGVESTGLKPIDPGTYDATCFEAVETTAKVSGNPMVKLTFAIQDERYQGRRCFLNLPLLPQTMWKVKGTFEAILGEELPAESDVEIDLVDLIGKPCRVKLTQEEYEGTMRERVQNVLPANSSAGSTATGKSKGPSLFS